MPKLSDWRQKIYDFETALRELVESPDIDSAEKALILKQAVGRPMGMLAKKHGLTSKRHRWAEGKL